MSAAARQSVTQRHVKSYRKIGGHVRGVCAKNINSLNQSVSESESDRCMINMTCNAARTPDSDYESGSGRGVRRHTAAVVFKLFQGT